MRFQLSYFHRSYPRDCVLDQVFIFLFGEFYQSVHCVYGPMHVRLGLGCVCLVTLNGESMLQTPAEDLFRSDRLVNLSFILHYG